MFEVRWLPEAFERLGLLVEHAADPAALVDAVVEIDRMLTDDPGGNSESRPANQRIAFALPLAVLFDVDEAEMSVEVAAVWLTRPI